MTIRVGLVAGSDAGHAIPVIALAERLSAVGDEIRPVIYTGGAWSDRWSATQSNRAIEFAELPGLNVPVDLDIDAGARLSVRAASMAAELAPLLVSDGIDVVVCDVITVAGAWAAELTGVPWLELSPHPLYKPSRGLPPIGSGLAPGRGVRGRLRDSVMRRATARSIAQGSRQRAHARTTIGLPPAAPEAYAQLIATLPALEVVRPDWPVNAYVVGPLLWEPTSSILAPSQGEAPLIVVAPSTAATGIADLVDTAVQALNPAITGRPVRVAISSLQAPDSGLPDWVVAGSGRQDVLLADAALAICGGGHGMLAKCLSAGVPVVAVPGAGDQWELAKRAERQGSARCVRPLSAQSLGDAVFTVLDDPRHRQAAMQAAGTAVDVHDPTRICLDAVGRSTLCDGPISEGRAPGK